MKPYYFALITALLWGIVPVFEKMCHEGYECNLRGAVYHVMARGIYLESLRGARKAIFYDEKDRKRFLEVSAEAVQRFRN